MDLTKDKISQLLAHPHTECMQPEADFPEELLIGTPRPAAVLIPLFIKDSQWNILFIRRTDHLADHSGQVAFPGGRTSNNDSSPEMTAMREANEEIGLKPDDVQILGRLQEFLTITNFRVTPVVAFIPWPYSFSPSKEEVAAIFHIPFSWLMDCSNREVKIRYLPDPFPPIQVTYFRPYQEQILWGFSARITLALLNLLGLL